MLPAISADLPAYLLPPQAGQEARRTGSEDFGPATEVELSVDKAVTSQSTDPGTGIYGPDGRFVESAARRDVEDQPRGSESAGPPAAETASAAPAAEVGSVEAASQPSEESPSDDEQPGSAPEMLSPDRSTAARDRKLALDNFDSIIPPAAKEELRSLADRAERAAAQRKLDSEGYEEMADLMSRLGRHPDAARARAEAEAMEQSNTSGPSSEEQPALSQLVQA